MSVVRLHAFIYLCEEHKDVDPESITAELVQSDYAALDGERTCDAIKDYDGPPCLNEATRAFSLYVSASEPRR